MSDYRRWFVPGGTYFFTVVTHQRRRFLTNELARRCLREAIAQVRGELPFRMIATVLLPDHLHTVWSLPQGDDDYSSRWRWLKSLFTEKFLAARGFDIPVGQSRKRRCERGVWQRRFWEHTVRDESDLKRCVDYLHWNPRKHHLVRRVRDWRYSTFHSFVKRGEYTLDWGGVEPVTDVPGAEWDM